MGLIILIMIGVALGWLATIVQRVEDARGIGATMLAGVIGSVVAGLTAGRGMLFGGLSAMALLWATVGAIGLIVIYNFIRKRAAA